MLVLCLLTAIYIFNNIIDSDSFTNSFFSNMNYNNNNNGFYKKMIINTKDIHTITGCNLFHWTTDFALPFITYTNAWVYSRKLCSLKADHLKSCQWNYLNPIMKEFPDITKSQMSYWNNAINEILVAKNNNQYISDITFTVKDAPTSKFKAYEVRCKAEMNGERAVLRNVLEAIFDSIESIIYDASSKDLGNLLFQKSTYDIIVKGHSNRTEYEIETYRQIKNTIIDLGKEHFNNRKNNPRVPRRQINLELERPSVWNQICGNVCNAPPMEGLPEVGRAISTIGSILMGYHFRNNLLVLCGETKNKYNHNDVALLDRSSGSSRTVLEPNKLMDALKSKKITASSTTSLTTNYESNVFYARYSSGDICSFYQPIISSRVLITPHGFQETLVLLLIASSMVDSTFLEIFPTIDFFYINYQNWCQRLDTCKYRTVYGRCVVESGHENGLKNIPKNHPKECSIEVDSNDIYIS